MVLSFASGGVTPAVHTDRDGKAVISHFGRGTTTVFVNGVNKGTIRAPSTETLRL
ncbi:MAG: hypothetical protein KJZ59_07355 [Pararhodobacter sp.]|nr:hypothetical protein [Pararhodobacter sp.]